MSRGAPRPSRDPEIPRRRHARTWEELKRERPSRSVKGCDHEEVVCGWGLLTLEGSRPLAGKLWTDSGEVHDDRGLKHRAADETREVPVPPELVSILREHVAAFGVADDGRLFRSGRGNIVSASSYDRVWHLARPLALRPDQVDSPMAARPYVCGMRRCRGG